MQISRAKESCYNKRARLYDSIIRIHILRSDSLDACTCGSLYCSAEPLPMGFTLPHTRLAFKRLRSLSCQRLGPPATLTTWVSLLYLRLTDPLEFRDAVLTWIHILTYTLHTTMRSSHETHGITPITHQIHVSYIVTNTFISYIQFSFHQTIIQQFHAIAHTKHTNSSACRSNNQAYLIHTAKPWINSRNQDHFCPILAQAKSLHLSYNNCLA